MKDGKLFRLNGDALDQNPPKEVRLKLYVKEPAELRLPSESFEKIVKMFTGDFGVPTIAYDVSDSLGEWAEEERGKALARRQRDSVGQKENRNVDFSRTRTPVPVTSAAALSEQQVFEMIVDEFAKYMQAEAGLGEDDKAWQSNLDALQNAIVDSGASGFYVNRKVKLSNVRPGRGSVLVANGVREAIAEICLLTDF